MNKVSVRWCWER